MPDITQDNVSVTLAPGDSYNPPGMPLVSFPTIAFGNGVLTYPTYGIPVPDKGRLGAFKKQVKLIIPVKPADGYIYAHDKTVRAGAPQGTIRIYQGAADAGAPSIAAASAGTPSGNVAAANFTGTPISPGTPTGNVADATLTIAAPSANLHDGTVAANAVSNLAVDVAAPTGNLANKVVTMEAMANITPAGSVSAPAFTGDALANHTHALTGGTAAAGPLVELGHVAVAATSLDLMVIGE